MTINLEPETVLRNGLTWQEWQERDEQEAMEGIRRGLEASAAGRVRPADAVFADMRAKIEDQGCRQVMTTTDPTAEALLLQEADAEEREAIRQGLEAYEQGRSRPFAEFAAEMRAKYRLPTHMTDEELAAWDEARQPLGAQDQDV